MSKIKTKETVMHGVKLATDVGRSAAQAKDTLIRTKASVREMTETQQGSAENYAADVVGDVAQFAVSNAPQVYRTVQQAHSTLRPKTREFVQDVSAHTAKTAASNGGISGQPCINANARSSVFNSTMPQDVLRGIGGKDEAATQAASPMQQRKQLEAQRQARTPAGKNSLHSTCEPHTPGSVSHASRSLARHAQNSAYGIYKPTTTQSDAATLQIKQKHKTKKAKSARSAIKTAQRTGHISVKTAKTTAAQAKHAATKSAQAAQKAKQIAQAAAKSLIAALVAGGSISVVVILVVLMIGLLLGSGFGIFFANDVPDGEKLSTVVQELRDEYYDQIRTIEQRVPHDYIEYEANDGITAIVWPDVLSVYAAQTA